MLVVFALAQRFHEGLLEAAKAHSAHFRQLVRQANLRFELGAALRFELGAALRFELGAALRFELGAALSFVPGATLSFVPGAKFGVTLGRVKLSRRMHERIAVGALG